MSKENVVAKDKRRLFATDEIAPDQECLRNSIRRRLYRVGNVDPPFFTVTEQLGKSGQILGRRDQKNVPDSRKHQG